MVNSIRERSNEAVVWALQREMLDNLSIVLDVVIDGDPASKSRPRFTRASGDGKVRAFTPQRTRIAEDRIAWVARQAGIKGPPRKDVSFGLFAKFFCKTRQRRDVDNMLKLVADGLTGVVWDDDSQVTEMSASVQRGVDNPRTHILVYVTLAQLPRHRPCEQCGRPVRLYPSQPNRFCSKSCSNEYQRERVARHCEQCGSVIQVAGHRQSTQRFCSRGCKDESGRVEVTCDHCGDRFTKQKSLVRKANYCTDRCQLDALYARRAKVRKGDCQDCGGPVSRKEYRRCQGCANKGRKANGKPKKAGK